MKTSYRVEQNPRDKQWYVLALVIGATKSYWMVTSNPHQTREQALKDMRMMPVIEQAQYKELSGL